MDQAGTRAPRLSIGDTRLPDMLPASSAGRSIGAASGFIAGIGRYSDNYRGLGGRAGLRIRF